MKLPFVTLKRKSGMHTLEYVMLMTLVMAGIIISTPYVVRSWNANLKGWDDSITDSINDPLLAAPPPGVIPTFCTCGPFNPVGCGLGIANTPLGPVNCGPTEMLYYSACSPIDCEFSAYPANQRAYCSTAAGCCTPWVDDVCGVNAIPHGDQPDGSCLDGYRLQTRTCGASAIPDYQCVADAACSYQCINVLPTGIEYVGLCPGDDTQLSSDTWYTAVTNGNCSSPAGSVPKCEIECAPTFIPNGPLCECVPQIDNSQTLVLTTTVGCNIPAPAEAFYQTNKIENYSIQGGQCVQGCTEIEYRAGFNDMHFCGGGPGPVRSFKGLDPYAANYTWQLQYYDHGWFTTSGSGFKPAGVTTVNTGVRTHQGSSIARNWIRLTDCGLQQYQWAYTYCDGNGSCNSCNYNIPWNGTCPTCDASRVGQTCAIDIQGSTDDDRVYTCRQTNQTICIPSNPPQILGACSSNPPTNPVCP